MGSNAAPPTGWPCIAVFGAGAVGCYFGARLAQAGAPVTLIGRAAHVEAIRRDGLLFESGGAQASIRLAAETSPDAVRESDVVLFSVKTRDTDEAARLIAPRLRAGATVVSLQNGVDNVPKLRNAGIDALGAVVYVACSMPAPGRLVHAGRGDLVVGEFGAHADADSRAVAGARADAEGRPGTDARPVSQRVARVAALFERAGVPCRVEPDVRGESWTKLVMNCAFNPVSALTGSRYGPLLDDAGARELMRELVAESVAVARAEGVTLDDADAQFASAMRLGEAMRQASSSMEQDLARGRRTEIDSLNGYVAERGARLGVSVPVNRALATLVRRLERQRSGA